MHVYAHALDFNFKEMCVGDDAEETGGVWEWVREELESLLPWSDREQAAVLLRTAKSAEVEHSLNLNSAA